MRDLIALYEIVLKELEYRVKYNLPNIYICNIITYEYNNFTCEEQKIVFNHFISERPSKSINSEFTKFKYYRETSYVWWTDEFMTYKKRKECNEQRILFIKHIINKLKQQNEEKS